MELNFEDMMSPSIAIEVCMVTHSSRLPVYVGRFMWM